MSRVRGTGKRKMIKTMMIPTMLLLAVSGTASVPSVAQPLETALNSVKTFDIAGIRPGMKAADAVALLRRTGWTVSADPGNSWLEVVEEAVARRRNEIPPTSARSGVYAYNAAKGEETVRANIVPTPDGGRVGLVQYRAPQAGRSHEQILRRSDLSLRPIDLWPAPTGTDRTPGQAWRDDVARGGLDRHAPDAVAKQRGGS
ncbi:hypothetical protein ACVOMT_13770 [Sphingomonas panni]